MVKGLHPLKGHGEGEEMGEAQPKHPHPKPRKVTGHRTLLGTEQKPGTGTGRG